VTERTLLWIATDPRGLPISLAADVWEHIVERHDDMLLHFDAVRLTIEDPDEIYVDKQSTRQKAEGIWVEAYYKRHILTEDLQAGILYVSVKFVTINEGAVGFVQTALPNRHVQKRMVLQWTKPK